MTRYAYGLALAVGAAAALVASAAAPTLDSVDVRCLGDVDLPADAQLTQLASFANGDLLVSSFQSRGGYLREDALWRIDPAGQVVQRIVRHRNSADHRVTYAGAAVSPSGTLALHRVTWSGQQLIQENGEVVETLAPPVHDLLIWNPQSDERWSTPVVAAFVWVDERRLAFLPDYTGNPDFRAVGILDTDARTVAAEVPVDGSIVRLLPVRPGVIAIAMQDDKTESFEPAFPARSQHETTPLSPSATIASEDPLTPFDHPWIGFGRLVALDLTDPTAPAERELMPCCSPPSVSAVSADERWVWYRTPTRPGDAAPQHPSVLYNTETHTWRSAAIAPPIATWNSAANRFLTLKTTGSGATEVLGVSTPDVD